MQEIESRELPGITDRGLHVAQAHGLARSTHWPTVRSHFLKTHPTCFCGCTTQVEVHHILPFHFCVTHGRPDLELDPRNLITMCDCHAHQHHLLVAHYGSFESFNPDVVVLAVRFKGMTSDQIKACNIWLIGMKARPKPLREWTKETETHFKALMKSWYPPDHAIVALAASHRSIA